jgi:phospholipid/cholesterol/gamma-HCH transport system substrate-binding protein
MRIRDLVSFVAFAAIVVFALGYFASLGVRVKPPSDRTNLSMEVPDVNSLVVGSNVLLRGVPVGKISRIQSKVEGATIDFYVDSRFRIPVDTEVRLENLSALGESYLGLVPHSDTGPDLHGGERITAERIVQPASISELATSVVRVLDQLDPAALHRIVTEADVALPDPSTTLPNLSHASTLLRDTVANMHGRGRLLLSNFQTLIHNATWAGPALAAIAPALHDTGIGLRGTIDAFCVTVDEGAPDTMVDFKAFLDRIQDLLDKRGGDLKVLGQALKPQLSGIAGALMNFDTGQFLSNVLDAAPDDGVITLHVTVPEK